MRVLLFLYINAKIARATSDTLAGLLTFYPIPSHFATMPTIAEFDQYLIRHFEEDDVETLATRANNLKITKWMTDAFPHPYTKENAEFWVKEANRHEPITHFALARKGEKGIIGGIGVKLQTDVHRRSAEIGYWLAEDEWGKGIMPQAVKGFSKWVFDNLPDLVRLEAAVFGGNLPSTKVLTKAGYQKEGVRRQKVFKNGQFHDDWLFALLREDVEKSSSE